ncbi:hypothetical protein O181_008103 [Austropuccinia psidii MF-1]|uniref:Uncharacterized protein n=1 Tax=Austropuccinia psidii MF-1 TaxID=1389203 RepID=A0A9Q3BNR5_9BASI|nr:hypothetical protein [Austropuccinia psidii MF-1]
MGHNLICISDALDSFAFITPEMSSKLAELTESSPSVPLPSVLCGSGIFIWLGSPWSMASSGHFDPSQTYDRCKAVEALYPSCTECLKKAPHFFQTYKP